MQIPTQNEPLLQTIRAHHTRIVHFRSSAMSEWDAELHSDSAGPSWNLDIEDETAQATSMEPSFGFANAPSPAEEPMEHDHDYGEIEQAR